MKRRNAEAIRNLVMAYLREEGLETPLNEWRAVKAWETVAGERVYKYTTKVDLRAGVLCVSVSSPALRSNLMMMRAEYVRRINENVGAQVVTDIRIS